MIKSVNVYLATKSVVKTQTTISEGFAGRNASVRLAIKWLLENLGRGKVCRNH